MENIAVLDLTDVSDLEDLHNRIKKALDFPDYYGANWNAFWDCLNRDCDVDFVKIICVQNGSLFNCFRYKTLLYKQNKLEISIGCRKRHEVI